MGEIGYGEAFAAYDSGERRDLGVRDGEELLEEAELVEEIERGGVDGVAAEVAEEVFVFFEDCNLDAGAGEEEAQHDARGSSADDAAGGGERVGVVGHLLMRVASRREGVKSFAADWRR